MPWARTAWSRAITAAFCWAERAEALTAAMPASTWALNWARACWSRAHSEGASVVLVPPSDVDVELLLVVVGATVVLVVVVGATVVVVVGATVVLVVVGATVVLVVVVVGATVVVVVGATVVVVVGATVVVVVGATVVLVVVVVGATVVLVVVGARVVLVVLVVVVGATVVLVVVGATVVLVVVVVPAEKLMWCWEMVPLPSWRAWMWQATWRQLTCTCWFWVLSPVKVLFAVTAWLKPPLELAVKRPIGASVHRSPWDATSNVHWLMSPLLLAPNPAPITLMLAELGRLSPSFGVMSSVTLGLPPGTVSGLANAAPMVPTVTAMARASAAR